MPPELKAAWISPQNTSSTGECSAAAELGESGIRAKNSFEGHVIARTEGRYVIVLLNPPPDGTVLLKSAAQALR
jgi:hypothetical protein